MTTQTQNLLTEAASLETQVEGFIDISKLATFVKGIAAHLLSSLPKADESVVHTAATEIEEVAPIVEALTPNGVAKTVEADAVAVASVVAGDTKS